METPSSEAAILVVDGHLGNQLMMQTILADLGLEIVSATSAAEALWHALTREFAVILLDLDMPGLDGFETERFVQLREKSRLAPLLFLTRHPHGRAVVARGHSLAAVDYLYKPLNPEIVRARVGALVELYRGGRQADLLRRLEHREHARRLAEMEEMNRQFQEASRLKSEFVANVSHELRTPLNAIVGFAQLLHDADATLSPEKTREFVGHVLSGSLHLLDLINDVLDLVKVESGRMEFFPERVHLARVVNEVVEIVERLAVEKRLSIRTFVDLVPDEVELDSARFRQVLYNYLSNAVKFTGHGGRIDVRIAPAGEDMFRLEVVDTGIGIRPEDMARLFVEFEQLDASAAKQQPGTGLGLALTRRIVEAQGGTVGVASTPGHGSTFHAMLPRRGRLIVRASTTASVREQPRPLPEVAAAEEPLAAGLPSVPPGHSILVVDDSHANLELSRILLEADGYLVRSAADAREALEQLALFHPSLVLLDIQMPGMDGLELARRLRAEASLRDVIILAFTAAAMSGDRQRAIEAGCDGYITKPVEPRRLRAIVASHLRSLAPVPASPV